MRRQADGKVRRSRQEWEQIFDRFRASGQSGAAFCRKHKLPKSSFEKWKKKLRGQSRASRATPSFVEWPTPTTPDEASISSGRLDSGELELALPGGVVLRWKP